MVKESPPRRILKGINQNHKSPEGEKKVYLDWMYADKHHRKFTYAKVMSESVEQLIDSTPGYWTVIIGHRTG
jgi:hypothetical protein